MWNYQIGTAAKDIPSSTMLAQLRQQALAPHEGIGDIVVHYT
jgi:hypothetical protein